MELAAYLHREETVREWLSRTLDLPLPPYTFMNELQNGVLLCRVMLSLQKRSIPTVHMPPDDGSALPQFRAKSNIEFFLEACRDIYHLSRCESVRL